MGAVANDAGSKDSVAHDGSPVAHERVELVQHETTPLRIENPGYLYCFANDAWCMYGNNHGSLRLTIRRVA